MKRAFRSICGTMLLAGLSAAFAPAAVAQITFNATAPAAKATLILRKVDMTGVTSVVKFKFTVVTPGAFVMGFCFQDPTSNAAPCGASGEYVVMVPAATSALAVVPASLLTQHQLVVDNPTSSAVKFSVQME